MEKTIVKHLEACAIKAIEEREVTYQSGTYTAEHLATCDPAPAWDGKEKHEISVDVDGRKFGCLYSQVFERLTAFGAGELKFTFQSVEQTEPTTSAADSLLGTAPVAVPTPEAEPTETNVPNKPKVTIKKKQKTTTADGTKTAVYCTCIEFTKSKPSMQEVRYCTEFSTLRTLFYHYDKEHDLSRIYKQRDPEEMTLYMVGAAKGNAAEREAEIAAMPKFKVIAEEGLQAAIDKELVPDMPHFKE